ncbi:hypothetical protein INT46_001499 [Mucor plumbeus]|uniref:Uncharacterized protein n=1 Tax=Mucor plumbeus TaxID=97098 RepID=A0A8H7VAW0_9FUNG|nr:hypothetical protein INT46_001499 [Mucor plumbeus]
MATLSEEALKKACRGRPKKNMQAEISAAEPSRSNAFIPARSSSAYATQAGPSITVTEFNLAIVAMPNKVRVSAAMLILTLNLPPSRESIIRTT